MLHNFPALDSFPHHKHLPDNVISTKKVSIVKVIKEANRMVSQEKSDNKTKMV